MIGAVEKMRIEGDTIVVTTHPCVFCEETHTLHVPAVGLQLWRDGMHIQDALPMLSAADRETLVSGTCEPCFDKAFGSADE